MEELVSSILGTGKVCPKCGGEMVRCGYIKVKGEKRKVWRCTECQHRETE